MHLLDLVIQPSLPKGAIPTFRLQKELSRAAFVAQLLTSILDAINPQPTDIGTKTAVILSIHSKLLRNRLK